VEKPVYPTYGHKARIGGIFPSRTAETTIYQFFRVLPPGSGVTWAGISLGTEALTLRELDRVRDSIVEAAVVLANSKVDIVVQCGVPVVVSKGYGYDSKLAAAITKATNLPAATDVGSSVAALKFLHAKSLAVATPFNQAINQLLQRFLEDSGFKVLVIRGLNSENDRRTLAMSMAQMPLSRTYEFVEETALAAPQADAIYVPGTPMPFVENIEPLEDALGKPIVGALPAMIWNCLSTLKVSVPITSFGTLLKSL
jgi:maleate isomerase